MRATKMQRHTDGRMPLMTADLDRIDRAILKALQSDASVSNVMLAGKVNLSPPACLRRVERLKALGLIKGIVALLNPKRVGLP